MKARKCVYALSTTAMPGGEQHDGGIVGRVQSDEHIVTGQARQTGKCTGQHLGADLGAAAAAAHRVFALHRRHRALVHPHPAPVYPVLPAPDWPAGDRHAVPPGQCASVA